MSTENEIPPKRDLVERLRDNSGSWITGLYDGEAADEIERLRAALAERERLHEVMQRMVAGIEHLSALARLWEPDHSSGSDRRGWLLAQEAKDDAKKLLAEQAGK